jgi:3alpha(or 20beta)-hydroxysteroid dehydrogenase
MARLDGKVVLITGAARGLGESVARAAAGEGARVVLTDILEEEGEAVAAEIGASARFIRHDVRRQADWEQTIAAVEAEFGPVSVLVNNAVLMQGDGLLETREDVFRNVFEVNELGCFLGMQTVVPSMRRAGAGSIVNISSIAGMHPASGIAYCSSKWAIRGITKSAARDLAPEGIRVNSVHPGWMRTPSTQAAPLDHVATRLPMRRIGETPNVAKLVTFLASDEADYITGGEYLIDGGVLLMGTLEIIESMWDES